jgi:hypothetical protein
MSFASRPEGRAVSSGSGLRDDSQGSNDSGYLCQCPDMEVKRDHRDSSALLGERTGEAWISRRVASKGIISVAWQQISCGKYRAGRRVDVHFQGPTLQIWDGDELIKTVLRHNQKEVRKRHASRAS